MNTQAATIATSGTARRLRFQEAVARVGAKAKDTGLARVIILPGSLLLLLGFNFMIWAWWGAAHSFRQIEQIPYLISGGLIGLAFVMLGSLLLASALWLTVLTRAQEESELRFRAHLDTITLRMRDRDSASDELEDESSSNGSSSTRRTRTRA